MFDAPVAVGLRFYIPRPKSKKKAAYPDTKPDIDKLARAALDALSTVIFRDDAQVVALQARKVYADAGARLDITIENWGNV
jgi:Holliday junction resolvase RusA-like endonuclease